MFLASVLASSRVNDDATADRVSEALDAQDLIEMNRESTVSRSPPLRSPHDWLISEGLLSECSSMDEAGAGCVRTLSPAS